MSFAIFVHIIVGHHQNWREENETGKCGESLKAEWDSFGEMYTIKSICLVTMQWKTRLINEIKYVDFPPSFAEIAEILISHRPASSAGL